MKRLTLNLDSLDVTSFATGPELERLEGKLGAEFISRRSCIEQCTTSCTP
jgi:hypothetical protein